jgi:hypothetical protein
VARVAAAEGVAPRTLLRAIEALAEREASRAPMFRFLRASIEPTGWISVAVPAGYALHHIERRERAAIVTVRRPWP